MSNDQRYGRASRALVLASLAAAAGLLADTAPDYRLAGIVAVGQDHLLAVIEMPDGKQGLFRAGDALGNGRIHDITRSDVRVEINGQELLLSLRGNPKLSAAIPVSEAPIEDVFVEETPGEDLTTRNQPLFYEDTARLLKSVSASAGAERAPGAPAAANDATAEPLAARLNELLGVPAGSQIVAVNGNAVSSPQDAIAKLLPLLGEARPVRLDVGGTPEIQTILITPVEGEISP